MVGIPIRLGTSITLIPFTESRLIYRLPSALMNKKSQ
jgi:hypothetical protein